MSNPGDHGPIDIRFRDVMNKLAHNLDRFLNADGVKRNGFLLMVFPFGEPQAGEPSHRCNYISNAEREDVIKLLEEQIEYFKAQAKPPG